MSDKYIKKLQKRRKQHIKFIKERIHLMRNDFLLQAARDADKAETIEELKTLITWVMTDLMCLQGMKKDKPGAK